MKNYFIIILILFISSEIHAQNSPTEKYGSNLTNGKHVSINEAQIYYETYGEGTPLLLLHGGVGSIINFQECIPTLAEHFKVIAVDSPGHGRSSHLDSLSYPLMADYISQFIDHLQLDSLYIMGWSDGGIIGLYLAADRPDKVKKLLAIGVNTGTNGLSKDLLDWTNNGLIDWAKDKDGWWMKTHLPLLSQPEKIDEYLENTKKMWLTEIYIPQTKVQSIKVPTMIMLGDKDSIKKEHTLEIYRDIENAQLCILPNTGHYVFGKSGKLVNQIAIDFFHEKIKAKK